MALRAQECKWEPQPAASGDSAGDWAQVGSASKKVEVRQSGGREDSPIQRIFGGEYRCPWGSGRIASHPLLSGVDKT